MTDTLDPALEAALVSVLEMKLSDGRVDYYVAIRAGDRVITPYKFAERWKAELEVAAFQHVLNNAPPVNYLDYGPEKSIAPVLPATPQAEIDRLRSHLREHWLANIACDHEAKTDTASCSCSMWRDEPHPSVDGAVDAWIEHVFATLHPETPNGGQNG